MNRDISKYESLVRERIGGGREIACAAWIGSLAHGGYSERFSDVDLLLLFHELPPEKHMEETIAQLRRDTGLADKLSVFWSDTEGLGGRFPAPDREDFRAHGKVIYGEKPSRFASPSRDDLRRHLREHSIPYWTQLLADIRANKVEDREKQIVRAALFPARFYFTWTTGAIDSNERAAAFCRERDWPGDNALVEAALASRKAGKLLAPQALDLDRIELQMRNVFAWARATENAPPVASTWLAASPWRSVGSYALAYGWILLAAVVSETFLSAAFYPLVWWFIAARQHSLYVLNHDASHGNLFASYRANKWVATALSNLPFFHHPEAFSFVLWRRVHVMHHAHLFSAEDPNYVGRKAKGDTAAAITGAKLVWNILSAPWEACRNLCFGVQDYVAPECKAWRGEKLGHQALLWRSLKHDPELETERRLKLLFFAFAGAGLTYFSLWKVFALYWFLPMYTFYPAILRLMDLTEHNWDTAPQADLALQTNSRLASLFEKIFISDHNRHIHWEHHYQPRVPWFRLSKFSRHLRSYVPARPPIKGLFRI